MMEVNNCRINKEMCICTNQWIRMCFFLLIMIFSDIAIGEKIDYTNYKVFKVTTKSDNETLLLKNLVKSNKGYAYWTVLPTASPTGIMVSPELLNEFVERMDAARIKYEKSFDNVQALIDHQLAGSGGNETGFGWTRYHTLDKLYNWLDNLPKKYPGKLGIIIGGHTFQGRKIRGVKISFRKNSPGIFIEGGIHANEWIAPATVTYLINELLTSSELKVRKLAESHDWYIFPTFNPDGYIYTHTTNRMWRKSVSKGNSNCTGVDLNRNWEHMWMQIGASNDSCSNMYAGTGAFSEIETKTMSEYIKSIGDKLFAYIDFHSFSQLLMVPYGNTTEHLDNYNETYAIGLKAAIALSRRFGTKYTVGNIAEIIYPATGSSMDWVKDTLKLPIAFSYELRDKGDYGFLLPPEQIIPTGQEVLDSLIVIFEEARKLGYPQSRLRSDSN